jgi:hypothetical protein
VANVKKTSQGRAEFDLVNKGSAPIVYRGTGLAGEPPDARGLAWDNGLIRHPTGNHLAGAPLDARGLARGACSTRSAGPDLIEPGETRHVVVGGGNCRGKLVAVAAVFADGSWAGPWYVLEVGVRWVHIRRSVAQQWLVTLRALRVDPDPIATLAGLLAQIERLREALAQESRRAARPPSPGLPPPPLVPPPEELMSRYGFVWRAYRHIVAPDSGWRLVQKRDERAEKALQSRADAGQRIADSIEREIAAVEAEIADTAWVTMLGPNGERIGPKEPPPPPRRESMALWLAPTKPGLLPPVLKTRPDR